MSPGTSGIAGVKAEGDAAPRLSGGAAPRAPSPFEAAFFGEGARVTEPGNVEEAADIVREAASKKLVLVPAGLGTQAYLGTPPPPGATIVSLARLDRVLRYEPGDFTIGVEAGARLASLRETLAANRQEIAVDFASSAGGTLGGLVAASRPGPRRARHGAVRSQIIGIAGLRGNGAAYRAGGMVVKNVAGYEVMKMLAGSLGAAGILLEVNLRLKPLPESRSARLVEFEDGDRAWDFARSARKRCLDPAALVLLRGEIAGAALHRAGALPAPGSSPRGAWAAWLVEGNRGSVSWQERELGALLAGAGARTDVAVPPERISGLVDLLCEAATPGDAPRDDLGIVRLSALPSEAQRLERAALEAILPDDTGPSIASDPLAGLITARWRGAPGAVARPVPRLEAAARELGAGGVLIYLPPAERRSRSYLLVPDPNRELARRILRAFDPPQVFYTGRMA